MKEYFDSLTQTQIVVFAVAVYATNLPLAILMILVGWAWVAIPIVTIGTILIWFCAWLMNDSDRER